MTNWEKYFGTPEKTAETLAEQKPMIDAFFSWADNDGALIVALVPPKGNAMHEKKATECYMVWLQEEALKGWDDDVSRKLLANEWNARYEPTCHDFGGEEGTNGEEYDFACSACGYFSDITEPNYCPNCGAKVVSE